MANVMVNTSMVLFALGNASALALGSYLYRDGTFTIGAVYLLFHYTNMLIRPIERITYQLDDLQRASASVGRVQELREIESKVKPGRGFSLPANSLSVCFRNVSFGYVEAEPVLRDLSFDLTRGNVLGLLGRTGSGKTTLGRLLLRIHDVGGGEIRLGEVDIAGLDLPELRGRVAMVTQSVHLFQATVRDNLTLFDADISDSEFRPGMAASYCARNMLRPKIIAIASVSATSTCCPRPVSSRLQSAVSVAP